MAPHETPLHLTEHHCTSLYLTENHCTSLHITLPHWKSPNLLHPTKHYRTSLHITVPHCNWLKIIVQTAHHCTSVYLTATHRISMYITEYHWYTGVSNQYIMDLLYLWTAPWKLCLSVSVLFKLCLFSESPFGCLGEVTQICLAAACGLFGIKAYLRLLFTPHSHQAFKLQWIITTCSCTSLSLITHSFLLHL